MCVAFQCGRIKYGVADRRCAFSLAELVVSIGILVLLFSLAGQVFTLTIQSTGQATALNEVNQALRAFEQTLREDLRHVRPGHSLLLIQANPVNAYWTQDGKAADTDGNPEPQSDTDIGYPHGNDPAREDSKGRMVAPRADMLMFFTARKGVSFVDPSITSNLQQVVYGHAELGNWKTGPDGKPAMEMLQAPQQPAFPVDAVSKYPSQTRMSSVPAEQWHLARRSVLLVPNCVDGSEPGNPRKCRDIAGQPPRAVHVPADASKWLSDSCDPDLAKAFDPTKCRLLRGELDVVDNFSFEAMALTPGYQYPYYLPRLLVENTGKPAFDCFARSRMDENPPMQWAERMGHFLLPRCASFKVEWTLDPRGEFVDGRLDGEKQLYWFDPGQPRDPGLCVGTPTPNPPPNPLSALQAASADPARSGSLTSLLCDRTCHPDSYPCVYANDYYSLADRFVPPPSDPDAYPWTPLAPDGRPNLVMFGSSRRNPGSDRTPGTDDDEIVPEDVFPSALRVTIDVYDADRRLGYPVRHVMVIPVGS